MKIDELLSNNNSCLSIYTSNTCVLKIDSFVNFCSLSGELSFAKANDRGVSLPIGIESPTIRNHIEYPYLQAFNKQSFGPKLNFPKLTYLALT